MLYQLKKYSFYALAYLFFLLFSCQANIENKLAEVKIMFEKGNFSATIPILEAATNADENNADAWNMLGIANYETKRYEPAITHFNKAIKLNNQNYRYFYNRANAQRELKLLLEAVDDYTKAIELETKVADIYFNKAVVLIALNRKKEAITDFESCLLLSPNFAKAHFGVASAQISMNQEVSAESCEHLQKALALGYQEAKEALALYCKK